MMPLHADRASPGNCISTAMSTLKEWAGIRVLGLLLLLAILVGSLCMCRLLRSQAKDKALLHQTFCALEQGHSPQIWLAALHKAS